MTLFWIFFYLYGIFKLIRSWYLLIFYKPTSQEVEKIRETLQNPTDVYKNNTQEHVIAEGINGLKTLPLLIIDASWLIIGATTEQSKLFYALIIMTPLRLFLFSISKKYAHSTIRRILLTMIQAGIIITIYYFKFFANN